MKDTLDKRVVIVNPDGTFSTWTFFKQGMLKNETEDQYIERELNSKILNDKNKDFPRFFKTKQEFKTAELNHPKKTKRGLKCTSDGVLINDLAYKTPEEIRAEKKVALKNKLKLTDDEMDFLVGAS